jgi:hypothetical protein
MPDQPDRKQSSKPDIEALTLQGLKELLLEALEKIGKLEARIIVLGEENARLRGLKGRPNIKPPVKPSGMEEGTKEKKDGDAVQRRRGERRRRTTPIDIILHPSQVPEGAVLKGYEDYWVQDIEIRSKVIRYRRQRWETADGKSIVAGFARSCERSRWRGDEALDYHAVSPGPDNDPETGRNAGRDGG